MSKKIIFYFLPWKLFEKWKNSRKFHQKKKKNFSSREFSSSFFYAARFPFSLLFEGQIGCGRREQQLRVSERDGNSEWERWKQALRNSEGNSLFLRNLFYFLVPLQVKNFTLHKIIFSDLTKKSSGFSKSKLTFSFWWHDMHEFILNG